MKIIKKTLATVLFTVFTACASAPVLTDDMTPQELIQNGQNEYEKSNYRNALFYYNAAVDRFGDTAAIFVEASYEIGHIHMKTKDYESAVRMFDQVIYVYEHSPAGTVPAAYSKLSKIELNKIPEAELEGIRRKIEAETAENKKN